METVNIQYKDRLFRFLFGREEMKENIISLYNAINNTAYSVSDEFEINTLEDAVYVGMKNDVSLIIDSNMTLWEQQSSYNPNMPIRGLMYFGRLYDAFTKKNKMNIYGSRLIKIPNPQYIVFYNGTREEDPVVKLRLTDAFIKTTNSNDFEWTATMLNLNKGKNEALLAKCKPLSDYMFFVNKIRENILLMEPTEDNLEKAIDDAVDFCIRNNILRDILLKNKAEVKNMTWTEFDQEIYRKGLLEEGREEGRGEGAAEKLVENVRTLTESVGSLDTALNLLKISKQEYDEALAIIEE